MALVLPSASIAAADASDASSSEQTESDEQTTYNQPVRSGVTAQFGFGLSYVVDNPPELTTRHGIGIWPGSFGLGYFMHEDFAVMTRFSGSSYIGHVDADLAQITSGYYGFGLQWWPGDQFSVAGGVGPVVYSVGNADHLDVERLDELSRSGWAFSLRGGYAFGVWESAALRVNLEVLPAFFAGEMTLGTNLGFEVQLF